MSSRFSLLEYFQRLGFSSADQQGTWVPNQETLTKICVAHQQAIPFENFDVLLRRDISIQLDDIFAKLVTKKRGGYCLEHNLLLRHVLITIGFKKVDTVLCRVRWLRKPNEITAYTHIALLVRDVEGVDVHVDVGFGGKGPILPLPLRTDEFFTQPDGLYRFVNVDSAGPGNSDHHLLLQWKPTGSKELFDMYLFRPTQVALDVDLEVCRWFVSGWPQAIWMTCLFASIVGPQLERRQLHNLEFTSKARDGSTKERRTLASIDEARQLIVENIGVCVDPSDLRRLSIPVPLASKL